MRSSRRGVALGLAIAASWVHTACGRPPEAEPYEVVADVPELMAHVVEPAAEVYWDAVGVIVDLEGVTELRPTTDEEWLAVENAAFVLAESGNLLMMSDRAMDHGAWMQMASALVDVGRRAVGAAEARDEQAVFDVGAELYAVCTNCHAAYAIEILRPSDDRATPGGGSAP